MIINKISPLIILQYKNKIKSEETKVLEPVQYER